MIAGSYPMNLNAFQSNTAEPFNFYYSSAYVFIWLIFLFAGIKTKSKAFSNIFLIFWTLSLVYFAAYIFLLDSSLSGVLYYAAAVFFLPLIGFDFPYSLLQSTLRFSFLYASITIPFLIVSLIMLLAGIAARKRRRKKAAH